ncbi:MAG: DUF421 domain-containing protein [Actinomycetota bacterium]
MEIVVRAAVIYVFLWIMIRAMGSKELSELSSFELVLLIVMVDIVQQGVTQEDLSVTGAILAVGTFSLLALLWSYVSYRWRATRPVIQGIPVIVVRDGEPLEQVLEFERLTIEKLLDVAREQGISNLGDVKVGVLEPDGKFSFLKHERRREKA